LDDPGSKSLRTESNRLGRAYGARLPPRIAAGCGDVTRTRDLLPMKQASCCCSTPQERGDKGREDNARLSAHIDPNSSVILTGIRLGAVCGSCTRRVLFTREVLHYRKVDGKSSDKGCGDDALPLSYDGARGAADEGRTRDDVVPTAFAARILADKGDGDLSERLRARSGFEPD